MDGARAANNAPAAAMKKRSPSQMEEYGGGRPAGKKTRRSSYIAESVKAGTRGKRWYEHSEHELDMSTSGDKLFKCNYWEDPGYAKRLEYFGLSLARNAALDNEFQRLNRELDALLTAWQEEDRKQPRPL